jgi:hypothetical protein
MKTFELSSDAFEHEGKIPVTYTCDDEDFSPPLSWDEVPEGTESFALICEDPDAPSGTWSHWVLYNIPSDRTSLPSNLMPGPELAWGAKHGINDFGTMEYGGPCPPPGKPHRYFFRMYALDEPLDLEPGATRQEVLDAMTGHMLGQAELMGHYKRQR